MITSRRSLNTRLGEIDAYAERQKDCVDFAVQFVVWDRTPEGILYKTGRVSEIYGGVLHIRSGEYTGDKPVKIMTYPVHASQLNYIESDAYEKYGLGGRGSGKSEAAGHNTKKMFMLFPGYDGLIVAPSFSQGKNIFYNKILASLPAEWIAGQNRTEKTVTLISGTVLRLLTSRNEDSLRAYGGAWCVNDEAQDISTSALGVLMPTLREVENPSLCNTATPKIGEFEERVEKAKELDSSYIQHFSSFENIFISHNAFKEAKKRMTKEMYEQEVLAKFVKHEGLVYHDFSRHFHMKDLDRFIGTKADITADMAAKWDINGIEWLIGMDYGESPMCAVVCKVFMDEKYNKIAYVHDTVVIRTQASPQKMGDELIRRGYKNAVVFDDAAGQYSRGGISASKMIRRYGLQTVHNNHNPKVIDRVNSVRAKLINSSGEKELYIHTSRALELKRAFENQIFDKSGKPSKDDGYDHILDALGYFIYQIFPPYTWDKDYNWNKQK